MKFLYFFNAKTKAKLWYLKEFLFYVYIQLILEHKINYNKNHIKNAGISYTYSVIWVYHRISRDKKSWGFLTNIQDRIVGKLIGNFWDIFLKLKLKLNFKFIYMVLFIKIENVFEWQTSWESLIVCHINFIYWQEHNCVYLLFKRYTYGTIE